ncbi:hypothetical protein EEL31_12980 [Brevibacillus laterosporus]|nr:hypothetical protein EEL31_12980 [Brevibacillus laterosporus]
MNFLKRQSRRNSLIKELMNVMNLPEEPFMEMESNDLFCKEVFATLNTYKYKTILQGHDYRENISRSIEALKDINTIDILSKEARVFFFREQEIEAVKLYVNDVFRNLEEIVKLTKFDTGYGDFILVTDELNFGVCIERTEYNYELSVWGIPNTR